jgi:hypothetical protein
MPRFPLSPPRALAYSGVFALLLGLQPAGAQSPAAPPVEGTPPPSPPEAPAGSTDPGTPSSPEAPGESEVDAPASPSDAADEAAPSATATPPGGGTSEAPSGSPDKPPPSPEPSGVPEQPPDEAEPPLKARLDRPGEKSASRPHLPPPVLRPEAARPVHLQASRTKLMPGNYVARPVTLPRGTLRMEFGQGLVLWDTPATSALAPAFALGVTERVEVGVDAPLHHDPGKDEWAALHPRPQLAFTWFDEDSYEVGTRIRALIPARATVEPSGALSVPVLFRANQQTRVDVVPEVHVGLGSDDALVARLHAKGTWQLTPGMFTGLGATAHVGFLDSADTGVDPEVTFGLTHQNYGRAFVDLVARAFVKSLASGESGHFSRGAGVDLALTFYPELY